MKDISTTSALVKDVLMNHPSSRNSDNLLYFMVCKDVLAGKGIDIDTIGFGQLFLSLHEYGLPQFETVGRVRRKLQQTFPELQCSPDVAMLRASGRDAFSDYAKDGE